MTVRTTLVAGAGLAMLAACGARGSAAMAVRVERSESAAAPRAVSASTVTPAGPASTRKGALAGIVIALDPGHDGGNGSNPTFINRPVPNGIGGTKACDTAGTQTTDGYPEHAFTFDVVKRAAALMRAKGATVVLTRTTDTGVGPCVDQRAKIGNRAHAAVAFSVHADGGPVSGRGFHVIEPAYHPGSVVDAVIKPSDRLARDLISAVVTDTGSRRSTYVGGGTGLDARTDLGGLMLSRVPKVFIEAANMQNPSDAVLCRSPAFRQRLAQALTDAAIRFVQHPAR